MQIRHGGARRGRQVRSGESVRAARVPPPLLFSLSTCLRHPPCSPRCRRRGRGKARSTGHASRWASSGWWRGCGAVTCSRSLPARRLPGAAPAGGSALSSLHPSVPAAVAPHRHGWVCAYLEWRSGGRLDRFLHFLVLSMGHGMDKLVRFVRHLPLVQLYAVVVVLLVQSAGLLLPACWRQSGKRAENRK